jgi:hypothetical protein
MGYRKHSVLLELREIRDNDPYVEQFRRLCLAKFGERGYISWIQDMRITRNASREMICVSPLAHSANQIFTNDMLGFGHFLKEAGVPSVVIKKPDGMVVGTIYPH